jgi:hypothetical protein
MGLIEAQKAHGLAYIRQLGWGILGAIASGGLLALALPPHNVPLLGFVAFVPVLIGCFRALPFAPCFTVCLWRWSPAHW